MTKAIGFLAAAVLFALFALTFFDVVLDPFPPWTIVLMAAISAVAILVPLLTTLRELEAKTRDFAEAEQKLRQWNAYKATLDARENGLNQKDADLTKREVSAGQSEKALATSEAKAHEITLTNDKSRAAINAEQEALATRDTALIQQRQELEQARQAQLARERELEALARERHLLPMRGSFFETSQEINVVQAYGALNVQVTVRPTLSVHLEGQDGGERFFVPLLGLPKEGAMHVHLCGPAFFRQAYLQQAQDFAKESGLFLIKTDEDSLDIQVDIERQLEEGRRRPDSSAKYQQALETATTRARPSGAASEDAASTRPHRPR